MGDGAPPGDAVDVVAEAVPSASKEILMVTSGDTVTTPPGSTLGPARPGRDRSSG
jgi:hypothetical protein